MECYTLVRKENNNLVETSEFSVDLLNRNDVPWVHLKVKDRSVFNDTEPSEVITQEVLNRWANPGKSFLVERIGNVRLLDCNVNYNFDDSTQHQLTLVFVQGKVITISTANSILAEHISPESIIDKDVKYDRNLITLSIFRGMLNKNTSLANKFTKKVDSILKSSIAKSFDTPTDELEKLHTSAIDLNELFEDQLTTIRLLPMNIDEENVQMISFLDRIEKSMEHLVKLTERSQDKLDYILQRYANVLQQKANARLNTLTIVQAIFVPLTFIAGVYGMNFLNMPELDDKYAYFVVLGAMAFIGLGGLYLFFRNGWFNSD